MAYTGKEYSTVDTVIPLLYARFALLRTTTGVTCPPYWYKRQYHCYRPDPLLILLIICYYNSFSLIYKCILTMKSAITLYYSMLSRVEVRSNNQVY